MDSKSGVGYHNGLLESFGYPLGRLQGYCFHSICLDFRCVCGVLPQLNPVKQPASSRNCLVTANLSGLVVTKLRVSMRLH